MHVRLMPRKTGGITNVPLYGGVWSSKPVPKVLRSMHHASFFHESEAPRDVVPALCGCHMGVDPITPSGPGTDRTGDCRCSPILWLRAVGSGHMILSYNT